MVNANETAVAFRVDGSADIGMGHVMRCLSLASQVHARVTSRIYFIMRDYDAAVDKVVEEGYTVLTLPPNITRMEEINQMGDMIERKSASVLVIDTPDADGDMVEPFRDRGLTVAVIDDLGGKKFHDAEPVRRGHSNLLAIVLQRGDQRRIHGAVPFGHLPENTYGAPATLDVVIPQCSGQSGQHFMGR